MRLDHKQELCDHPNSRDSFLSRSNNSLVLQACRATCRTANSLRSSCRPCLHLNSSVSGRRSRHRACRYRLRHSVMSDRLLRTCHLQCFQDPPQPATCPILPEDIPCREKSSLVSELRARLLCLHLHGYGVMARLDRHCTRLSMFPPAPALLLTLSRSRSGKQLSASICRLRIYPLFPLRRLTRQPILLSVGNLFR